MYVSRPKTPGQALMALDGGMGSSRVGVTKGGIAVNNSRVGDGLKVHVIPDRRVGFGLYFSSSTAACSFPHHRCGL